MIEEGICQSAKDWRMISSSSTLDSPLPKVKVLVRLTIDWKLSSFHFDAMQTHAEFTSIVFLQGEAAMPALKLLAARSVSKAIDCLRGFETGDEHLHLKDFVLDHPWGSGDVTRRRGDYVIAANSKLQYVSLAKRFGNS